MKHCLHIVLSGVVQRTLLFQDTLPLGTSVSLHTASDMHVFFFPLVFQRVYNAPREFIIQVYVMVSSFNYFSSISEKLLIDVFFPLVGLTEGSKYYDTHEPWPPLQKKPVMTN